MCNRQPRAALLMIAGNLALCNPHWRRDARWVLKARIGHWVGHSDCANQATCGAGRLLDNMARAIRSTKLYGEIGLHSEAAQNKVLALLMEAVAKPGSYAGRVARPFGNSEGRAELFGEVIHVEVPSALACPFQLGPDAFAHTNGQRFVMSKDYSRPIDLRGHPTEGRATCPMSRPKSSRNRITSSGPIRHDPFYGEPGALRKSWRRRTPREIHLEAL